MIIPLEQLLEAERLSLSAINKKYGKVGHTREWFNTPERRKIVAIIIATLAVSRITHEKIA